MGCCISVPQSTRVAPSKKSTNNNTIRLNQTDLPSNENILHNEEMFIFPKQIMSGVSHIPRPYETDFVVCLTENSFPLAISPTSFDDKDKSRIIMPIVGFSLHEKGRVAVFGNIEILTECKENAEFSAFFENLLSFISGPRPSSSIIYLLDVDPGDSVLLIHNINGLGYHIESGKSSDNLSRYACVITIGGTSHGNQLYDYIVNGGGVIVCSSFDTQKFIPSLPFPYIGPSSFSLSQFQQNTSSTTNMLLQQSSSNLTTPMSTPLTTNNLLTNSTSSHGQVLNKQEQTFESKQQHQQQQQQQLLMDYVNKSNHRANAWLSRCGLGISDAHIVFPIIPKAVIKITTKSHDLERASFPFVVDCYKKILRSENIDTIEFTNIINDLRYNILTINRAQSHLLAEILDESLSFLQDTNYIQPEGLFYSDLHGMLAVLLCDIIRSINPREFTTRNFNSNLFPGDFESDQDTVKDASITVSLRSAEWHSTGLWLPARTIATVTVVYASNSKLTISKEDFRPNSPLNANTSSELPNDALPNQKNGPTNETTTSENDNSMSFEDLFIQIGSQSESLLSSPGPWKRWPNVVVTYPITEDTFEISSPFGGLIYINDAYFAQSSYFSSDICTTNENENQNNDSKTNRPRKMIIKFSNVIRCPFFSSTDRWNETKDSQVPWSEISTKYSIITLPTEALRKINNLELKVKIIDNIIKEILTFSCYSFHRRFRLVFDIDSPKTGSTSSYPLVLSYDTLDSFINIDTPSSEVFAMILKISIVTIPENSLHPNVEASFGALIASHTLLRIYSTKVKSPYEFIYGHMTPIFNELWNIYTRNDKKLFQTIFGRFQHICKYDPFLTNEESVQYIVSEMESITEKKFPSFLEEALHPGENEDEQFPEYIVEEEEDGAE